MSLGKLVKVDLRQVWQNEASDFTPWLAKPENLEALSETLRMQLQPIGTEHKVGEYRADLLCKDEGSLTNKYVLIENQLEKTNHSHLGQILTYAAGLDAEVIIWIASKFSEEHRAALDFLNSITAENFRFFGLEVELWRIGNSDPAPKFNIVSQPNGWSKTIKEIASRNDEVSETKQQQHEYWVDFKEFVEENSNNLRLQTPAPQHWMNFSIGRSGFWRSARVNSRDFRIAVSLQMRPSTCPSSVAFEQLLAQKEEIENEFGSQLEWAELPDKAVSIISVVAENANFMDMTKRKEQFEWLLDNLEKFDRVFRDRIRQLDLDGHSLGD